MADGGRPRLAAQIDDGAQGNRLFRSRSADRDVAERLHRDQVLLPVLCADEIVVPVPFVDPECWVETDAGVRSGHQVLHHVFNVYAGDGRLDAVDLHVEDWVVHSLRDPDIGDSFYLAGSLGNNRADAVRRLQIAA